jgi:glucose/arabinose dehydrogenase
MARRVFQFVRHASLLLSICRIGAEGLPKVELTPVLPEFTFAMPVALQEAPDNSHRLFIAEQDGRIWSVHRGATNTRSEFLNITNRQPHASYEQGLLGLAFHPQFQANRLFYIYYSQQNPRRTVLSEFSAAGPDADRADLGSERVLLDFAQPSEVHKGGQIGFGPDGFLYIGVGDGGPQSDPANTAQNTAALLGKILRIDVNTRSTNGSGKDAKPLPYGIPKDNPFVGEPELPDGPVRKEIWAYGLRNPWRFSWDRETGALWVGDVGQDKWEEIDRVVKGGNYGWCLREASHRFKPGPEGARYIDPTIEYSHDPNSLKESKFPKHTPGMCVVGGYVYRGSKNPSLRGVYLYADFALGTIWGMRYSDGRVLEQGTLVEQPKNITSFAEDLSGELYVLTGDGHIYGIGIAQQR